MTPHDAAALVQSHQEHRDLYLSPRVFELEQQCLWASSWLFVGHGSQVPAARGFLRPALAGPPRAPHPFRLRCDRGRGGCRGEREGDRESHAEASGERERDRRSHPQAFSERERDRRSHSEAFRRRHRPISTLSRAAVRPERTHSTRKPVMPDPILTNPPLDPNSAADPQDASREPDLNAAALRVSVDVEGVREDDLETINLDPGAVVTTILGSKRKFEPFFPMLETMPGLDIYPERGRAGCIRTP